MMLLASPAHADQWTTPAERRLTSPNKRWEAVITPATDGHTGARTTIAAKGKPGTPFATVTSWMPVDALLFDDGSLLVLDGWHQLGHGTVAAVHDRDGSVRWSKTLEELIGSAMIDNVTASVSSIWWRKTPLEWTLARDGKRVTLTLIDENELVIALANGDAKIVPVSNLGDDPQRLVNRARVLARTDGKAALHLLDRALAKAPELFEALLLSVDVLQRANEHARVHALVERVSARWKTTTGYDIANVCVVWAKSLVALGRPGDAERVLKRGIASAPTYVNPTAALATLLFDQKRAPEADAAIDAFVARLFAEPSLDTFALSFAAEIYQQRRQPAKAIAIFLRGYKRDEVTNQFLYMNLAAAYEETGNTAEAIRVNEQLRAYFTRMGPAFDTHLRATEEQLARLRKK